MLSLQVRCFSSWNETFLLPVFPERLIRCMDCCRLFIHLMIQKWKSTMMPSTRYSVAFMNNSSLIVLWWLRRWHSKGECLDSWTQNFQLRLDGLYDLQRIHSCLVDAKVYILMPYWFSRLCFSVIYVQEKEKKNVRAILSHSKQHHSDTVYSCSHNAKWLVNW